MRKGFTLIELLVYMAIMGFIIVVAGRAYSDATGMRVRTQNMTKATEDVNKVAELIKEDLSQMGAKMWYNKSAASSASPFEIISQAYIDPKPNNGDSSSFNLWRNATNGDTDTIAFRKIFYGDDGKYIGTRLVKWYVAGDTLFRSCATIHPSSLASNDPEAETCPAGAGNATPVIMAENVEKFALYPSKPLGSSSSAAIDPFTLIKSPQPSTSPCSNCFLDDGIDINPQTSSFTITLSNFARNDISSTQKKYNEVLVGPPSSGAYCKKFSFQKNETYFIKFKTPMYLNNNTPDSMMALFQPGRDHLAVGFRNSSNYGKVSEMPPADFMFYPPQENNASSINQYFEFSVTNDVSNVCVAFTIAIYSGSDLYGPDKGHLMIKDFELQNKKDKAYTFERGDPEYAMVKDPVTADDLINKRNVKAFELILELGKKGEIGSTSRCINDNCAGYVIPVPNNGIVPQEIL